MRLELDDEKKKNEDLQFKVEENEIMASGDSSNSEELQTKIKNLENQLEKSKSTFIENQTEFQTKIKILESELEVQKKASTNHESVVEQLVSQIFSSKGFDSFVPRFSTPGIKSTYSRSRKMNINK